MAITTLSKQSKICLDLLEDLCSERIQLQAYQGAKDVFKECLGRYRVWSEGVGSLQDISIPTSLEHRLQPAPSLVEEYHELLGDLAEELRRAIDLIPSQSLEPQEEEYAVLALLDLGLTVDSTITALFRLTSIVRRRAPRDRFAIAQRRIQDDDVFGEAFETARVGELFRRLQGRDLAWLRRRLGEANNARRKFLKYSADHQKRVSSGARAAKVSKHTQHASESATQLETPSASASVTVRSELSASYTVATTIAPVNERMLPVLKQDDYRSVVSDGSIYVKAGRLHPMTLEEASAGKTDFECPYCKIPVHMDSPQRWFKHIYEDLKAYVCTHEHCEVELPLFDSVSAWMAHEIEHLTQWQCLYCPHQSFTKQESLKAHLVAEHSNGLSDAQLGALTKARMKPCTSVPASICRFCDWTTELRTSSTIDPKKVPLSDYRRHLAAHLQQIALITVTEESDFISDDEEGEDETGRHQLQSREGENEGDEDGRSHLNATRLQAAFARTSDKGGSGSRASLPDLPQLAIGLPRPLDSPAVNNLRLIAKAPDANKPAVNIVLVSLPWLLPCEEWFVTKYHRSEASIGNVAIYAFEEWRMVPKGFTWSSLHDYGRSLANSLLAMCRSTTRHSSKAILLMAHSLAGMILKHSLVLMHTERDNYRLPRDTIRGVLFMGTPHCSAPDRRHLLNETSASILKLGEFPGHVDDGRGTDSTLLAICQQFNDISGDLPIVSLHETSTSSVKTRSNYQTSIIVDKRMSMIDASNMETLTSIGTDHRTIPTLQDESSHMQINKHALRNIRQFVRNAQDDFDFEMKEVIAQDPKLPCFVYAEARERNKDFHGREAVLTWLNQCLVRNSRVAVVHGIGGVGKSDIAIEFAHRHRDDFDAVFWIPADDVNKMRQVFARTAQQLGLEDRTEGNDPGNDPHKSRELVKAWLADPKFSADSDVTAKWLIIFDGADVASTLNEFEPVFCRGSVLITTQDPYLPNTIPCPNEQISAIALEFFEPDDAALLLRKMAAKPGIPLEGEDYAAREIVRRHRRGGSPLVISSMAKTIREKLNVRLSEFLDMYDFDAQQDDAEQGIMADAMKLASLPKASTELLQVCAMLDPDRIQESLFVTRDECAVQLKHFPSSRIEFAIARAGLLQTSLMQRNPQRNELWMHRVVRDTVLRRCSDEDFNASFRSAAALVRHAWKAPQPQSRDNKKFWEPVEVFLSHVLHLQHLYTDDLQARRGSTPRVKASFDFAWLLCQAASYKTNIGETVGVKEILNLALSMCEALPQTETQTFDLMCDIYHYLGAWANETNHPLDCYDYNSRYLKMRQESVDNGTKPEDEQLASTYNQYGTGLMMLRRYEDAIVAFQTSIALYATVKTTMQCPDSLPTVNLAVAKWLMGDLDGAYELLESGLLARQEVFGLEDTVSFRTGRFLHALGNVRWDQGNYPVSKIWHFRALKQYDKTLVNAHHRTADVRYRVAQHHLRDEEYEKAASNIEQALKAWRTDPNSFRQEIARTTWLKARLHETMGYTEEAESYRQEATQLRRQVVPSDARSADELGEEDFDELVAFWSR